MYNNLLMDKYIFVQNRTLSLLVLYLIFCPSFLDIWLKTPILHCNPIASGFTGILATMVSTSPGLELRLEWELYTPTTVNLAITEDSCFLSDLCWTMSTTSVLQVPSAFIPALKGLKGQTVRSIEGTSSARIKFTADSSGITNAVISGLSDQVALGARLIKLAVLQAKAARATPMCSSCYVRSTEAETQLDFRTFLAETTNSRAMVMD